MDAEGGGGGGGGKQVKGNAIVKKPHGIITLRSLLPGGSKPEADSVRPSDRIIIEKLKTGNNKQQGPVNNKGGAPPPRLPSPYISLPSQKPEGNGSIVSLTDTTRQVTHRKCHGDNQLGPSSPPLPQFQLIFLIQFEFNWNELESSGIFTFE